MGTTIVRTRQTLLVHPLLQRRQVTEDDDLVCALQRVVSLQHRLVPLQETFVEQRSQLRVGGLRQVHHLLVGLGTHAPFHRLLNGFDEFGLRYETTVVNQVQQGPELS